MTGSCKLVMAEMDGFAWTGKDDLYRQKQVELIQEKASIEDQIRRHKNAHESIFEQIEKVVKVANAARQLSIQGDFEKAKIALLSIFKPCLKRPGYILLPTRTTL